MLVWVLLGIVCTFVIATVSIGLTTSTLAVQPRRSVYDIEDAVNFVAGRLSPNITAQVSFDQVASVLQYHCDYLELKGVASERTADDIGTDLVVIPDDEPVAFVLGKVDTDGLGLTDQQVLAILDAETEYYRVIGVFGPAV